jgi:hypothetical protein
MTSVNKPMPQRATITADQLKAALTRALQGHPECQGIKVTELKLLADSQGLANWDAEFEAGPGVTMTPECKRVLLGAKQGVQKHFDLAGAPATARS